jgi:hypothetical protein
MTLCPGREVVAGEGRGACRSTPARASVPAGLDQAALTSIILGIVARGAGTLTSSMPFTYFASTWVASTPSGRAKSRWNAGAEANLRQARHRLAEHLLPTDPDLHQVGVARREPALPRHLELHP